MLQRRYCFTAAHGRYIDADQDRYQDVGYVAVLMSLDFLFENHSAGIQLARGLIAAALGVIADTFVLNDTRVAKQRRCENTARQRKYESDSLHHHR